MIQGNLKEDLKIKKAVTGAKEVLKALRNNKLEKVYIAKNCPVKEEVKLLCKLNSINFFDVKENSSELGTFCKKPFEISIIGFKK